MYDYNEDEIAYKKTSLSNLLCALNTMRREEDVDWPILKSIECDGEDRVFLLLVMNMLEMVMMGLEKADFKQVLTIAIVITTYRKIQWSRMVPAAA